MIRRFLVALFIVPSLIASVAAQDLNTVRSDELDRLKAYVLEAIQPNGLVRDSIVLNNPGGSFHPATPDAAGFALVGVSALHHAGKLTTLEAEGYVEDILQAHLGQTPDVTPARSAANGYYIHSMNVANGTYLSPWDASYTPIGTALLVAGAQFAGNHFTSNATIGALAEQLTNSVNFNKAIKSDLNGGIFLNMGASGNGVGGTVSNWNEFMLVESLALREADNSRALAVKHKWLDPDFIPKAVYDGIETLTDSPGQFAPAFWVQQMQFFNGDFRHSEELQAYHTNQQLADQLYSSEVLGEEFRYGLTAGLVPSPVVYHADAIFDHPFDVFSPEAVAAWGDMDALLQFHEQQNPGPNPSSNPSYQFGMVRVSADQPSWVPPDAALVDHLFLLFGLVESLDPNFFADRVFAPLAPGDYNANGSVDGEDYALWKLHYGSTTNLAADGNSDGVVDAVDYTVWRNNVGIGAGGLSLAVPEPNVIAISFWIVSFLVASRSHQRE
jgi:hypothetical protein